jgi:hypothetical protein
VKKAICLAVGIAIVIIIASLLVSLSVIAKGQSLTSPPGQQQSCPIRITGKGVKVHFRNDSDKPVTDVIFRTMVLDAVGDEYQHTDPYYSSYSREEQTYSDKKGVNPGEAKAMVDNMTAYGKPDKGLQIVTYTRAVRFADGTNWKDDGSHSCRWGGR